MKKVGKAALAVAMSIGLSLALKPSAALAMTADEYWQKSNEFLLDPRWANGTSWGAIAPKLSTWSSSGCCAYTADFAAYVYDAYNQSSGTPFYDVSDIQTGDIIHTGHHWFVVVERDGDTLRTAEGNARLFGYWFGDGDDSPRVMVSDEHYYISGNTIIDSVTGGSTGFAVGYHNDTGGATTQRAAGSAKTAIENTLGTDEVAVWKSDSNDLDELSLYETLNV